MNNLLILTIINRDKKKDEPAKTKAQRRAEKNKEQNGENGEEQADSGDDKVEENGTADVKLSPKEEDADDVQWSTDTSKEAVERRRRELLGDGTTQLASLVQNELNISDKPVEEKPKTKGKLHTQFNIRLANTLASATSAPLNATFFGFVF